MPDPLDGLWSPSDQSDATRVKDLDDKITALGQAINARAVRWIKPGTLAQRPVINAQNPGSGNRAMLVVAGGKVELHLDVVDHWHVLPLERLITTDMVELGSTGADAGALYLKGDRQVFGGDKQLHRSRAYDAQHEFIRWALGSIYYDGQNWIVTSFAGNNGWTCLASRADGSLTIYADGPAAPGTQDRSYTPAQFLACYRGRIGADGLWQPAYLGRGGAVSLPTATLAPPGEAYLYWPGEARNLLYRRTNNGRSLNGVSFPWEWVGGEEAVHRGPGSTTSIAAGATTSIAAGFTAPVTAFYRVTARARVIGSDGNGSVCRLTVQRFLGDGTPSDQVSDDNVVVTGLGSQTMEIDQEFQLNANETLQATVTCTQGSVQLQPRRWFTFRPQWVA